MNTSLGSPSGKMPTKMSEKAAKGAFLTVIGGPAF